MSRHSMLGTYTLLFKFQESIGGEEPPVLSPSYYSYLIITKLLLISNLILDNEILDS